MSWSGELARGRTSDDACPPTSEEASYLLRVGGLTGPLPVSVPDEVLRRHGGGRGGFELWKVAIVAGGRGSITMALVRLGT